MAAPLSQSDFNIVVRLAPLVSIDLIVRDAKNQVLLGLRNNEPAKNYFFVPGGVIRKSEPLAKAFARISKAEINHSCSLADARFLGVYDHFYETNAAEESGYGTRYIVLVHEIRLADISRLSADSQHRELGWWTETDLIRSDRVHENTKAYFRRRNSALTTYLTTDRRKQLAAKLIEHLESAQAITDEIGLDQTGYLVERALDDACAMHWPHIDPNVEGFWQPPKR